MDKASPATSIEVKALRIVLIALLILYAAVAFGSAFFIARVVPQGLATFHSRSFVLGSISVFCDRVVPGLLFFFIAYGIFRLIGSISRGESFSPKSPHYIRMIGYAVFGLFAASAIVDAISSFTPPVDFLSQAIMWFLLSHLGTLLLGFGFLVIAKVLEVGVRLQQDQNLTV
jgi:hypothetical protein